MGIYSAFTRNVTLPIYDLVRDTSRFRYGRILQRTQWFPRKKLLELQNQNLRLLIKHAYDTVPYYHRVMKQNRVLPQDIQGVEDLTKIPVLTKDDVRANSADLVSLGFPVKQLVPYRSGGSGDQLQFFVTKDQLSWEIAAEYRGCGYGVGSNDTDDPVPAYIGAIVTFP